MAKSRPGGRGKKNKKNKANGNLKLTPDMAEVFFEQALSLLHEGQPEKALPVAQKILTCLSFPTVAPTLKLPALDMIGEIYIELGDPDQARKTFLEAVRLDPEGIQTDVVGAAADKFLWLAQICEEGGEESVKWFEIGAMVLRRELGGLDGADLNEEETMLQELMKQKLANALCGAAEVYMTDLSWNDDAEVKCEALVTEACLIAPESPEPLQTLASVRISQTKFDDARSALSRSLDLWTDLPPEDPLIPDFPTRISLARLLMEASMEDKAMDVLERLVAEDDNSVEAWYLGGWCLHLLSEKTEIQQEASVDISVDGNASEKMRMMKSSRDWLQNSLKLYGLLGYEDDRLQEHAKELVGELNKTLGPSVEGEQDVEEEYEGWVDEDDIASQDDLMEVLE